MEEKKSMTTGEKLQKLRKDHNYTQEELADIMNVSRQSISKWESDAAFPETEKLLALSKLYHCTVDYLLNADNNDAPDNANLSNEQKGSGATTKKGLPFIITCISVHVLVLILFCLPWFRVVIGGDYYYTYYANVSYFELAFFIFRINGQPMANGFALIAFLAIVAVLVLLIVLILTRNKAIDVTIRISNIFIPSAILGSMLCNLTEWTITGLFVGILYAALIVCQFAVKPLRRL